jgi:hypothetical protein
VTFWNPRGDQKLLMVERALLQPELLSGKDWEFVAVDGGAAEHHVYCCDAR